MAMNSSQCWDGVSIEQHELHCNNSAHNQIDQQTLEEPMPWIGMYIALATLICTLAMSCDLLNGIRYRRFWFRCKFFSLSTVTLSLLAVMKLTMDFSNTKLGYTDALACVTSLVFMMIAMGNFMTSVGSMCDSSIISKFTALAILVVTVAVNIFLYTNQLGKIYADGYELWGEQLVVIFLMLLFLIPFCSLGVVVDTIKKEMDVKLCEMHKTITNETVEDKKITLEELKTVLKKYWVMAETGSMQFVIAQSAICVIPSLVCLLMALTFPVAYLSHVIGIIIPGIVGGWRILDISSSYDWSITYIILVQIIGVLIGIISPLSRWYIAAKIWRSLPISRRRNLREELKMETYWTKRLKEWRESRIPSQIHSDSLREVLHVSQRTFLYLCIKIQTLTVLASKLVLIVSAFLQAAIFGIIGHIVKLVTYPFRPSSGDGNSAPPLDFSKYALLLEDENKLPKDTIENICKGFDIRIKRSSGIMYKPIKVAYLLKMSENFNGVGAFDKVPSLLHQEPPNCWSLPLVTLAYIVQSLPKFPSSPLPGLRATINLVKLVEEMLNTNAELLTVRKAADKVWDEYLKLHQKRQDEHIAHTLNKRGCTYKKTLETLISSEFMGYIPSKLCSSAGDALDWSPEIIAANSMYKICKTLLLTGDQTDEQMFKRLSIIIADILTACLTNLPRAMIMKCGSTIIAEKESSSQHAAGSVYEASEVLEYLEQREWPDQLDCKEAGYIDAWRAVLMQEAGNPVTSASETGGISIPGLSNGDVFIEIES